jgi:hypothetical protein
MKIRGLKKNYKIINYLAQIKRGFFNLKNQSKNPNGGSFLIFKKLEPESSRGPFKTKNTTIQVVTHNFNFKSSLKILTPHVTRGKRADQRGIPKAVIVLNHCRSPENAGSLGP